MHLPRRTILLAATAAVTAVLAVAPAGTAGAGAASGAGAPKPPRVFGALTQLPGAAGCSFGTAAAPCRTDDGLQRATKVTVSPDGRQAATTTLSGGGGLIVFDCHADGSLAFAGCVSVSGILGSAPNRTCAVNAGMDNPLQALFTADGRSLLVLTGYGNGAVLDFDRDAKTGALRLNKSTACFDANGSGGCSTAAELASPEVMVEDPLDHFVHVGALFGLETLVRDPRTGALAHWGCLDADGDNGCTEAPNVKSGIGGLAFDPLTRQVWAASQFGGDLLSLQATAHGDVVDQCLTSGAATMYCGSEPQLAGPLGLAVVRHGSGYGDLYVTDISSNALLHFHLSNTGPAVLIDCRAYSGSIENGNLPCSYDFALSRPWAVTASADGRDVYVASAAAAGPPAGAQLVAAYTRSASTGDLTPMPSTYRCVKAAQAYGECAVSPGLKDPEGVTLSPNGADLYVNDPEANGLLTLHRQLPPACPAVTGHTRSGHPATIRLRCADPNADRLTLRLSRIRHGTARLRGGRVVFRPKAGFHGMASFVVQASDGGLRSGAVTDRVKVAAARH